ncbi:MAG: CopG family ribbon-helix-helix protein [Spirochaetota bacterium]
MPVTTVRLNPEVERELSLIADRTLRSKSWLINRAVEEFIERERLDQERWKQTLEAVESAAKGNVVAAERVHGWLRSWGSDEEIDLPGTDA